MLSIIANYDSFYKKKDDIRRKLAVLEVVEREKHILFDTTASPARNKAQDSVLAEAKKQGIITDDIDWDYFYDDMYLMWQSRVLSKLRKVKMRGSEDSRNKKLDEVDLKILDIMGSESNYLKRAGLYDLVQKLREGIIIPKPVTENDTSTPVRRKKSKKTLEDYTLQKEKFQVELIKHSIYLRQLTALKLERSMGLNYSIYTQRFAASAGESSN